MQSLLKYRQHQTPDAHSSAIHIAKSGFLMGIDTSPGISYKELQYHEHHIFFIYEN
jgi:hypothetical protein